MVQPVAIVGLACRLPGPASDPDALWRLLLKGGDAVSELTSDRFNLEAFLHPRKDEPGRSYTFAAGTLPDIRRFDAHFFGISPREAEQMDPQQRLLLELTYEALESGGFSLASLSRSRVAVYLGVSSPDYGNLRSDDPGSMDPYSMTGNTLSVAANRISHAFDWRGPSMAVDTACSSSLIAFHEAHRVVALGEAPMAVVAGVNMLLSPIPFVGFSRASMLAPDGRCRPFDASGQGYVRAEGGVVVVLKPLRQAVSEGDRILGVVRGVGTNADGHTRGIALPNGDAQEALLRSTYERAGVDPSEVSYFEAHGTGTPVGDPIEARAIARAIAMARRADDPLPIGSVKSNLGHLEPASGLAGLAKCLLILRHGVIPPSIHFHEPNPNIDFEGWGLQVVTHPRKLPARGNAPIIGINSFGFGGANAHLIVEGYRPKRDAAGRRGTGTVPAYSHDELPPLALSARSGAALRRLAGAMAGHLKGKDEPAYYDVAWSSAFRREWHPHRVLVRGASSVEAVREQLRDFAREREDAAASSATLHHAAIAGDAPFAWVFSGNGAQWPGMMRGWLAGVPGAREALARVDGVLEPLLGWSVVAYVEEPPAAEVLAKSEVAQPLLFAIQASMVDLLRAAGARPALVVGHSLGEVASAYASGGLSLEDAARIIVVRSRAVARTEGMGTMAAAGITEARADEWIRELGLTDVVAVAGVNSPRSVTLTGDRAALERLATRAEADEVFYTLLDLDYPFHSAAMDPVEEEVLEALEGVNPRSGDTPFISTVTGDLLDPALLVADYWWHNLRQPVRFAAAVDTAHRRGVTRFLEIGPHGILGYYLRECREEADLAGEYLSTTRKGQDEVAGWVEARDTVLLAQGLELVRDEFPVPGNLVELPPYPWDETPYWFTLTPGASPRVHGKADHPLLGISLDEDPQLWERTIDPQIMPWLADHRVAGTAVFPAAAFLEMAVAAARRVRGGAGEATPVVERLEIRRPLAFHEGQSRTVQTRVTEECTRLTIRSRLTGSGGDWVEHALVTLTEGHLAPEPLPPLEGPGTPVVSERHYREAERRGLTYGECFQVVGRGQRSAEGAEAELATGSAAGGEMDGMHLSPLLVDGAFQLLLGVLAHREEEGSAPRAFLPVTVGRCHLVDGPGAPTRARTRLTRVSARSVVADFDLLDDDGALVAALRECRFQQVSRPGTREWHENLLVRREVGLAVGASDSASGSTPPVQRRVALIAPRDVEAVGAWTVKAVPGELEVVVSHPDGEHLARLRSELPALPNLRVQAWDEPLPCDEVHVLEAEELSGVEAAVSRWRRTGPEPLVSRRWVAVVESADAPAAQALLAGLRSRGHRVDLLELPLETLAYERRWDEALTAHRDGEIWLLAHGALGAADGLLLTQAALALARALHAMTRAHPTQLCALLPSTESVPEAAAIPALFRVLTNELEGVEFRTIELAREPSPKPASRTDLSNPAWLDAWADHPGEMELRVVPSSAPGGDPGTPPSTASGVSALRIHRTPALPLDEDANVQLAIPSPGLLDRLRWEEVPKRELGEGEVRIRVRTTGLNFRDVMWTMGLLHDEAVEDGFAGATLGMECAGEILEAGSEVTDLAPGDRVLAFAPSAFAREVVTDAAVVAPIPARMSFSEAASLPTTAFTAYYSLHTLARLQPGERVLIHGGAGGVGLAAIQWAQHVGAEIFATVGSEPKRALLRELGVPHILHSRDLSFADEVRRITGGEGVDVALNSLAGEAMQATLELLRPFGRFLELGKRDYYLNSRMAMRALRNNISYHGIDADQLLAHRPAETRAIFRELLGYLEDGTLEPLPQQVYEADRVEEAFRTMQKARHMGKVVVSMDPPPREVAPRSRRFRCRSDASYLVVGGTGGFGMATARWLAASGARTLVLASRRGEPGSDGAAAVEELRSEGVHVELLKLDATDAERMDALPGELKERGLPPLRGVIHAAMVLDDRAAAETDSASLARVWHPKVSAARNLDRATRSMGLDWTVYYSSATTLFGNPGQANYVAANRALEALAEARNRDGYPTLAVAWGPIEDAGYLVRNPQVKELLTRRLGREPLTADEALRTLGELLARDVRGVRAVLPMAWKRLRRSLSVASDPAYLWLDGASARETEERLDTNFHELAASLEPGELRSLVLDVMTEQVASVLRLPEEQVTPDRPLSELGMDSLMAVELGVAVERQFGIELPMMAMSDGMTLRQMTERVTARLRRGHAGEEGETPSQVVAGVDADEAESALSRHGVDLSDEEREQAAEEIEERLRESGGGGLLS